MKKIALILLLFFVLVLISIYGMRSFQRKIDSALSAQPAQQLDVPTPTPTSPQAKRVDQTLFVPYWSLSGTEFNETDYKTLIYFGVKATEKGLDHEEEGYDELSTFTSISGDQQKILGVRMIESSTNFTVLKDEKAQERIIKETVQLAQRYHFDGILLNIEISAIPFASLVDQITEFNKKFAKAAHGVSMQYSITAYGDSFYRVRPFDMEKLAREVDMVYIMAYDFHKAKGNPGPNFPLGGNESYGYDYTRMINSFANAVPLSKITVVFGMYGYDWSVDEKNVPQEIGEPLSLKEIKNTIIDTCEFASCSWERDGVSGETKATYTDSDGERHIVWFEDKESVKRKQAFLKQKGIGSFAYWAYSYF